MPRRPSDSRELGREPQGGDGHRIVEWWLHILRLHTFCLWLRDYALESVAALHAIQCKHPQPDWAEGAVQHVPQPRVAGGLP